MKSYIKRWMVYKMQWVDGSNERSSSDIIEILTLTSPTPSAFIDLWMTCERERAGCLKLQTLEATWLTIY